jgi:hypothetical protein
MSGSNTRAICSAARQRNPVQASRTESRPADHEFTALCPPNVPLVSGPSPALVPFLRFLPLLATGTRVGGKGSQAQTFPAKRLPITTRRPIGAAQRMTNHITRAGLPDSPLAPTFTTASDVRTSCGRGEVATSQPAGQSMPGQFPRKGPAGMGVIECGRIREELGPPSPW